MCDIPKDERCLTCAGHGVVSRMTYDGWNDDECPTCEGTGRRTRIPTADSRRGDSERSTARPQGESEASGEEARALTGGAVELRRLFGEYVNEVHRECDALREKGLSNLANARWREKTDGLVELSKWLETKGAIAPAVSAEVCQPWS